MFLVFICLFITPLTAHTEMNNWNGSFSLLYQRKYLALKSSRNIYNTPMLWGVLDLNLKPSGIFTKLWWSENTRFRGSFNGERGNEFELTSGWKKNWSDCFYSEISTTLYTIHFNDWNSNPWILTTKIGKEINPQLNCELWLEWLSPIRRFCNGDPIVTLNFPYDYTKAFELEKLSLQFNNMFLWDNVGKNDQSGIFLRQYFGAKYSLTLDLNIFGGFTPLWKLTKTHDDRKSEHTYCMGIKYFF